MTDPTSPSAIPEGWYPISAGSSELRWWDGTQWTEHKHSLGSYYGQPLRAPEGTSSSTVWIWIFALLPLLQLAELPFITALYSRIFAAGLSDPTAIVRAEFAPDSGYVALVGVGFLQYGIYVVLAVLDYRALSARGVPQPFHWAWTFLAGIVYIIGRTVVVRRRTGAGLAPLWLNIIASVGVAVTIVAVTEPIVNAAFGSITSVPG